jgi:hypothetical protein
MVHKMAKITVEWSDGSRYSLTKGHIARLFGGNNSLSNYLVIAFSPDLDDSGWVEDKESKDQNARPPIA